MGLNQPIQQKETGQLDGGVISISWDGATGPADFIAVFDIGVALPGLASLVLFGLSLAGVGVVRRRRA
jgi:hypothetical protein